MEPAISSDLIRGHIDTIILHTLLNGDKFAQQISEAIEAKSENEYKINQATLYSSLKRLESLKHVTSYWNDSDNGRRKYFRLTELGKSAVDGNLSSWTYSRAIIDKLMDCSPQPIYQTKIVEVEKRVEVPVIVEKTVKIPVEVEKIVESSSKILNSDQQKQISKQSDVINEHTESVQEVNFRNILNGLIKSAEIQKQPSETLQPLEKQKIDQGFDDKLKFNDTIKSDDYNTQKSSNTGKIDFGDLALKAAKEGYKIRISSKDSGISCGSLLINKLKLCSSLVIFLLMIAEFFALSVLFGEVFTLSTLPTILSIIAFSIFPIIMLVRYIIAPQHKTSKVISADSIFNSTIIVFNLLLITFAANLLIGVNFSDLNIIVYSLITPCIVFADFVLYYLIRFLLSKTSIFNLKRKKTA